MHGSLCERQVTASFAAKAFGSVTGKYACSSIPRFQKRVSQGEDLKNVLS